MRVFVGFDPRQPVAAQVLIHSIYARASKPVSITPLVLSQLPITRRGLTDFTYSRFLVPYLCDFKDYAVFMDSDVLCLGDVQEMVATGLMEQIVSGEPASVWVVPHGMAFERPSVMVFNNEECKALTPEFVQDSKNPLFPLEWAKRVGHLPKEWNHLVGYDPPNPDAKVIHFTQGIPCWPETEASEFCKEWRAEAGKTISTVSFDELMGRSVHAKPVRERLARAHA